MGRLFGFEEYDAPVLEKQRLYKIKAGDAGEEIVEQMYAFTDKEGKEVTLRPEMTPTLARMVLQKQQFQSGVIQALMPLKWFTVAQCWRFESCQRGRKREHYQWNMDIVGVEGVEAELELLASIATFFSLLGIGPEIVGLKVNSRKILQSLINSYGITDQNQFTKVCIIVDKLDKIGDCAVLEELAKIDVSEETGKSLLRALKAKSISELNKVCGARLDKTVMEEMTTVFDVAKGYTFEGKPYRLSDYLEFDASVVRGLAYYTGIVFEAFDRKGWKLRAICGGGRYDNLMSVYGSKKRVPMCGFGFGDCVIMELLKEMKAMPRTPRVVDYVVAYYSKDLFGAANKVASALRASGKTVNLMLQKKDAKSSFSFADRAGALRCVFVAPDEWGDEKTTLEKRHVRIKDLTNADMDDKGVDVPFLDLARADSYFSVTVTTSSAAPASATVSSSASAAASASASAAVASVDTS